MLVWPALFLVWMNKGAVPQGLSGRRPYWVVMVGATGPGGTNSPLAMLRTRGDALVVCTAAGARDTRFQKYQLLTASKCRT